MKKITKELESKSVEELEKEVTLLRQELGKIQLEQGINPQKDTNVAMKKRKRISVMLTLMSEKKKLKVSQNEEPNKKS